MTAHDLIAETRSGRLAAPAARAALGWLGPVLGVAWLLFITASYLRLALEALTRKGELAARDIAPLLVALAALAVVGLVIGAARSPGWGAGYAVAVLGLAAAAVLGMLPVGGAAWPVAVVLWLALLGAAAGGRLLDRLFSGGSGPIGLGRGTFGLALAFGLTSHAMLALGLLGLLYSWLVAAVLLGLSALVRRDLLAFALGAWRGMLGMWSNRATMPERWFGLPLLALLAAWTVLVLIETLAPEIFYDAANYHLGLPDLYAEQHRIVPTPYRIHSYLSLGTEMLYLLAMLLGGQSAARLVSFAFWILTALGMFAFARQWLSARAGLLAAALFVTTPLVAWEGSGAFVDLALSAYGFFAVAAAHHWLGDRRPAWLILAGLMAGFALSAKLNALFLLGGLGLALLVVVLTDRDRTRPARLRALLSFGGAALLSGAPWPLFRWVQTGNPVFPFFNHLFKSPLAPAVYDPLNLDEHSIGTSPASLVRLPWAMTFESGAVFTVGQPSGILGLGLLMVPLLAAGRWAPRERAGLLFLSAVGLLFAAAWTWTSQLPRYFFPALPIVYVLVGAAMSGLRAPAGAPPRARQAVAAAPYLATLATMVATMPVFMSLYAQIPERLPYRVAFGVESRSAYLSRTVGVYDAFQYLNERHPGRSTHILAFAGERHLYSNGTVASMYSPLLEPTLLVRDLDQVLALIRERGFSHLVIDRNLPRDRLGQYVPTHRAFLDVNAELEHRAHNVEVYRLLTPDEQAAGARTPARQLLANAGFEQLVERVPVMWRRDGSPRIDRSGSRAATGQVAAGVTPGDGFLQIVPVRSGQSYVLRHVTRADGPSARALLLVRWLDPSGAIVDTSADALDVGPDWVSHEVTITAPGGAVSAQVHATAQSGRVWVDDYDFRLAE